MIVINYFIKNKNQRNQVTRFLQKIYINQMTTTKANKGTHKTLENHNYLKK